MGGLTILGISLAVGVAGGGFLIYVFESTLAEARRIAELKKKSAQPIDGNASKSVFRAADYVADHKHHLLLCATGSVATIKIPLIVQSFEDRQDISIRLLFTASAAKFLQGQSDEQPSLEQLSRLRNVDGIYFDEDEWAKPWIRGDSILHIELRRWADLMAIVPLSANSLAKLALGTSDDLISSVARAWDTTGMIDVARPGIDFSYDSGKRKGIIVAPAMNTAMWEHPITVRHMQVLQDWGVAKDGWFDILMPQKKTLACGDTGSGAMMDWKDIVRHIEARLAS